MEVMIQKGEERNPCCHDVPEWTVGVEWRVVAPRSRM